MCSRALLSLSLAATAAGIPWPEATTPPPKSKQYALRGAHEEQLAVGNRTGAAPAADHAGAAAGANRSSSKKEKSEQSEQEAERQARGQRDAAHYDPGEQAQQGEQAAHGQNFDWQQYVDGGGAQTGQGFDWSQYAGDYMKGGGGKYMQGGGGNFDWQQYTGQASGNHSGMSLGVERHNEANASKEKAIGFNSWLQEMLPPGDHEQYVDQWTGTWSALTAPQESMYSNGSQGYSQYVARYESMAGKHPSAAGSWQSKMQEQKSAYGTAVGQDIPGNADSHWQGTKASTAPEEKHQSARTSEHEEKDSKVAKEQPASPSATVRQQARPAREEAATKPAAEHVSASSSQQTASLASEPAAGLASERSPKGLRTPLVALFAGAAAFALAAVWRASRMNGDEPARAQPLLLNC